MTALVWDSAGSKVYETGLDRGVLYTSNGSGVAWNGLTGVTEDNSSGAVTPYFLDGVKYLDSSVPSDYAATLTAITYPNEFLQFDGVGDDGSGILYDNQPVNTFGLSYRTLLGSDTQGIALGYRIHLLYNLTAVPTNHTYVSLSDSATLTDLSWALSGVPIDTAGFRPTCHLMIDSTKLDPGIMAQLQTLLYGSTTTNPTLPDFSDLKTLIFSGQISS